MSRNRWLRRQISDILSGLVSYNALTCETAERSMYWLTMRCTKTRICFTTDNFLFMNTTVEGASCHSIVHLRPRHPRRSIWVRKLSSVCREIALTVISSSTTSFWRRRAWVDRHVNEAYRNLWLAAIHKEETTKHQSYSTATFVVPIFYWIHFGCRPVILPSRSICYPLLSTAKWT